MPIFEITRDTIKEVPRTSLAEHGFRERHDLQRLLRQNICAVVPNVYVLAEEYCQWEDARRRIDLLCIDKEANLVVIELKRTEDGGHMELQAIRYAAMISKMTFAQAIEAHSKYLAAKPEEAEAAVLEFLGWEERHEKEFAQETRIILVASDFSKEITTSAYWLNEHSVDICCVRLRPYSVGDRVLLDIQQVFPLPEATEILIKIKNKVAEERQSEASSSRSDWTRYDLNVNGNVYRNLTKRKLFLLVIRALIKHGVTPSAIGEFFPDSKFVSVSGDCDPSEFHKNASKLRTPSGGSYDLNRYYTGADEIFVVDGRTYAVSTQSGQKASSSIERYDCEISSEGSIRSFD